jgi:Fe-S cluster biogenesis protein NfuA
MTSEPVAARDDGPVTIVCPRCAGSVEVRYYGPCDECRTVLRRTLVNEARAVEREAFEPAMHVTPNAVALKDD